MIGLLFDVSYRFALGRTRFNYLTGKCRDFGLAIR
jgi:hypothetical protein